MKKILVTVPYMTDEGRSFLKENGCEIAAWDPAGAGEEELIDKLSDCHAVIAGGEQYTKRVLDAIADHIKIVARTGVGTDAIDLKAAAEAGVVVTNTPGATSKAVAEMTLALMLSFMRNIPKFSEDMKAGRWDQSYTAREISDLTVGLIGMGNIGKEVVRLLRPFGMPLMGFDVNWDKDFADEYDVRLASLDELASNCDVVSIHVPLNEHTRGMIDMGFLKAMRKSAFIINTSRGAVIDRESLQKALSEDIIAGAALDAQFDIPCKPGDPILASSNVIATPQVAYKTKECIERMVITAAKEIVAVFKGEVPKYPVKG
jgi:D-3-phosphoglycerate dehydrogenase